MQEEHSFKPFTELEAWRLARKLKVHVYALVKNFPEQEKYELTRQLVRSVRSISANIAEGHGRFTYKDQYNFCVMARGYLMETLNHCIDAYDCAFIGKEELSAIKNEIDQAGKVLNGYMAFLKTRYLPKHD